MRARTGRYKCPLTILESKRRFCGMLHEIFILNLCYDQLGAVGFVKSNVRMLQFTLPFIYKDKFQLILGAFFHSME